VAAMSRPTSFYYAFLALPRPRREAIVAVWDFCRAVDDTVDEATGGGDVERDQVRRRLREWRDEIERCWTGTPRTAQGRALVPWIAEHQLTRQPFADLVDGVEMDLDHARYETFDALYEYCWRVASTVGFMCIEIFGVRSEPARAYARHLGVALQLTNILRDVRPDLERGRVYLPQADLSQFGCTEDALRGGVTTEPVRRLVAFEAARAHDFYAKARTALRAADRRALVAAEIMGAIYRELLTRIERGGYDVLGPTVRVPRPRQAVVAATAWLRNRIGLDAPA
jgi:15-cis-phytoene synthase